MSGLVGHVPQKSPVCSAQLHGFRVCTDLCNHRYSQFWSIFTPRRDPWQFLTKLRYHPAAIAFAQRWKTQCPHKSCTQVSQLPTLGSHQDVLQRMTNHGPSRQWGVAQLKRHELQRPWKDLEDPPGYQQRQDARANGLHAWPTTPSPGHVTAVGMAVTEGRETSLAMRWREGNPGALWVGALLYGGSSKQNEQWNYHMTHSPGPGYSPGGNDITVSDTCTHGLTCTHAHCRVVHRSRDIEAA